MINFLLGVWCVNSLILSMILGSLLYRTLTGRWSND